MHALSIMEDVLGPDRQRQGGELQNAMRQIGEAGAGVVVLIREPSAQRFLTECVETARRVDGRN